MRVWRLSNVLRSSEKREWRLDVRCLHVSLLSRRVGVSI